MSVPCRYWIVPPAYVYPAVLPPIRPSNQRKYDVLLYAKYADLPEREKCVQALEGALKAEGISHTVMAYGKYKKEELLAAANNARIAVLASWYDTGGIGQIEVSLSGPFLVSFVGSFALSDDINGVMLREETFCEPQTMIKVIKGRLRRPMNHHYLSKYNLHKYSPAQMVLKVEHYMCAS